MKKQPEVRILTADALGVPLRAVCSVCPTYWQRPDEDPYARTLPEWGRRHWASKHPPELDLVPGEA